MRNIFKFKPLNVAVGLALGLSVGFASAALVTVGPVPVTANTSFSDLLLGQVSVTQLSNVAGSLGFLQSGFIDFGSFLFPVSFSTVSFTGSSLTGTGLTTFSTSGSTFSFTDVGVGLYDLRVSGSVGNNGDFGLGNFIGAAVDVTPVPEPETYAMFMAGLGLIGALARRRNRSAA